MAYFILCPMTCDLRRVWARETFVSVRKSVGTIFLWQRENPICKHLGWQQLGGKILWKIARLGRGATWAPPPAFHTLVQDMSLNRGATHSTLELRSRIISSFLLLIYLRPLWKLPSCAPAVEQKMSLGV